MSLFYIHICSGIDRFANPEGIELPSLKAAFAHARERARSIVAAQVSQGADEINFDVCIENASGVPLAALPISARVLGLS